ncbi:hypothetical protein ACP70R_034851 [Stipagrostis hirtigluma subsp. patula]
MPRRVPLSGRGSRCATVPRLLFDEQAVALQIVLNIFTDYDDDHASTAMEAVPALCNLLQSSDKTILESTISCLAMVAAGASGNAEHLSKLCKPNAVEATMSLMNNDGWKSLSDDTLTAILGLLKNLASISAKAVKSLFEFDVCELLKQMIAHYSSSRSGNDKVQMLSLQNLLHYRQFATTL